MNVGIGSIAESHFVVKRPFELASNDAKPNTFAYQSDGKFFHQRDSIKLLS